MKDGTNPTRRLRFSFRTAAFPINIRQKQNMKEILTTHLGAPQLPNRMLSSPRNRTKVNNISPSPHPVGRGHGEGPFSNPPHPSKPSTPFHKLSPKILPSILIGLAGMALAASAATEPLPGSGPGGGAASSSFWDLLIPVAVPLVIAGLKWVLPNVPKVWLPILAPVLGAGLEIVLHFAGLASGNGIAGALLGAAGVGLREIIDQVKRLQGAQAP